MRPLVASSAWVILWFALAAAQSGTAPAISHDMVMDIAHTYGFCVGQDFSLDQISKRFPKLAAAAVAAKYNFEAAFGPSKAAMDEAMSRLDANKWNSLKQQMQRTVTEKISHDNVTEDQAVEFINAVRSRASGNLEERVLQTLLIWNPSYRSNPAAEFAGRFRQKFAADGTGKSKGIKIQMEYPRSWASFEGERPNIVRKFVSERGRGLEFATITVKAL